MFSACGGLTPQGSRRPRVVLGLQCTPSRKSLLFVHHPTVPFPRQNPMSLYYEAAPFLEQDTRTTIKSRIYSAKDLKNKPAHIFALISEAAKWSSILSPLIETTTLLQLEKKLTPALALLLTHDLLLSKSGVAAPKDHVLRLAVERHKARLNAEFIRARLKAKASSIAQWKVSLNSSGDAALNDEHVNDGAGQSPRSYPRWIRINTLKTSLEYELSEGVFEGWERLSDNSQPALLHDYRGKQALIVDANVASLVATPAGTDLTAHAAYKEGRIIFQDKASCFPVTLMAPHGTDGDIIDACAAPGNKTTHLAALLSASRESGTASSDDQSIYGIERDPVRSKTLHKMVEVAGATGNELVKILARQDFLQVDAYSPRWRQVGALLLDPSCSGSGIVGRDSADDFTKAFAVILPKSPNEVESARPSAGGAKKRKRTHGAASKVAGNNVKPTAKAIAEELAEDENIVEATDEALKDRLASLQKFQLAIILQAFRFPAARKVVYSTCSIHSEENEDVVQLALESDLARRRNWRVLTREEQPPGMREWKHRGRVGDKTSKKANINAEACIRCFKGTEEGTMGFFVVGFVREASEVPSNHAVPARGGHPDDESEWGGLSDADHE